MSDNCLQHQRQAPFNRLPRNQVIGFPALTLKKEDYGRIASIAIEHFHRFETRAKIAIRRALDTPRTAKIELTALFYKRMVHEKQSVLIAIANATALTVVVEPYHRHTYNLRQKRRLAASFFEAIALSNA